MVIGVTVIFACESVVLRLAMTLASDNHASITVLVVCACACAYAFVTQIPHLLVVAALSPLV